MTEDRNEGKSKILLVEDDENIAKLFLYNLKKLGYGCELAVNGQEGFDMVKQSKPDLIISDIMMPEVDGFQFREMLMKDEKLKAIPFIFLTAKGEDEDILKGYDLGIQDYILKTSGPKVILAKVSAIIKMQVTEREKAEAEVQKAADSMGAKVVPDKPLQLDGFRISQWHVPFQKVPGGDFIDYVKIDDDRLAIVLGDVMGKKWGAWYFAVAYAGYIRSALRFAIQSVKNTTASQIMSLVNESVYNDERISEVFVTMSLVLIDKKNKTASYSGAGDLPLLYYNQLEVKPVQSKGLLLGFSKDGNYEDIKIDLKSSDIIFLITDGIIESRNKESGAAFKSTSIISAVMNSQEETKLENIIREFQSFTQGNFEDDISIIEIKAE
jgi:sigma-B regulation protein RsbU (phosphoserine phosphatase)